MRKARSGALIVRRTETPDRCTHSWHADIVKNILAKYFEADGEGRAMIGTLTDAKILSDLVAERLPLLKMHFKKKSIKIGLVTMPMFITMFVNSLPSETVFRAWDRILFEGPPALFDITLNILSMLEPRLLECEDDARALSTVLEATARFFDPEPVVRCSQTADELQGAMSPQAILLQRELIMPNVENKVLRQHSESLCLGVARNSTKFSISVCKSLLRGYFQVRSASDDNLLEHGLPRPAFCDVVRRLIPNWKDAPRKFLEALHQLISDPQLGLVRFSQLMSFFGTLFHGSSAEKVVRTLR